MIVRHAYVDKNYFDRIYTPVCFFATKTSTFIKAFNLNAPSPLMHYAYKLDTRNIFTLSVTKTVLVSIGHEH